MRARAVFRHTGGCDWDGQTITVVAVVHELGVILDRVHGGVYFSPPICPMTGRPLDCDGWTMHP